MQFDKDMPNALKAIKSILDVESWKINFDGYGRIACDTKDGKQISFVRGKNYINRTFAGIESLYEELIAAPIIVCGKCIKENPWYRLSNEEIFIKCELEQ